LTQTSPNPEGLEAFTWVLYRVAAYAANNLIDDAAMLSLIFV